jgi:GUN4-like
MADDPNKPHGWWQTFPGILTAMTGLITALTGLIVAFKEIQKQLASENQKQPTSLSSPSSPTLSPSPPSPTPTSDALITLSNGNLISTKSLQMYLQKKDFENANKETGVLLFKIANLPGDKKRFSRGDSKQIDCQGLKSIDTLWRQYSNNQFGLSTQKDILLDVQTWGKFTEKVGWKRNGKLLEDRSQLAYDITAPIGHLPGVLFWISDDSNFYNGISCIF